MKIKTISRSSDNYVPVRNTQKSILPKNNSSTLHPFEKQREYAKALQATKLERLFAKPFLYQLGRGHADGVYSICKNDNDLSKLCTGSGDGFIKYWNLNDPKDEKLSFKAHNGIIKSLTILRNNGNNLLSCGGEDNTVKLWSLNDHDFRHKSNFNNFHSINKPGLIKSWTGEYSFQAMDSHKAEPKFVTGGYKVELWDINRSNPISDLTWGSDSIISLKFNPLQTSIFATSGSDNNLNLYDLRTNSSIQKLITSFKVNSISWNPIKPHNFMAASEDENAYYYDMRFLKKSLLIFKDHVAPILDIDFSSNGREFVTGSYDKTIRIFNINEPRSRDIYHTKRMQHVFKVIYSSDNKYIISGSDDCNVRVWRSKASERSNIKSSRELTHLIKVERLKEKYKNMPEIKRISRHRHLPKGIKKAKDHKIVQMESIKRKEFNEKRHRKPEYNKVQDEKEKHIVNLAFK
ncbi:rRNA-processing protein SOF1 [Ascoidea rubescens DSM 1968]|uniref:WD40 repeat-like protein n=1 Tax=Ascoidea rubescens DSM 1968 TaxID=1344418 RepID=A0A1D2V8B1_9ASCO|nr:WD40 repeat-like protein [Ascoidea rubescens DSM 1968]ODV57921.1 WD40 repeat-like protein [Ascoidea rubescens DSM 1968]